MPLHWELLRSARRPDEVATATMRAVQSTFEVERSRYAKTILLEDLRTGSPSCVYTSDRLWRCWATIFWASARAWWTVSVAAEASAVPTADSAATAATPASGAATFLVHGLPIRTRATVTRNPPASESDLSAPDSCLTAPRRQRAQ